MSETDRIQGLFWFAGAATVGVVGGVLGRLDLRARRHRENPRTPEAVGPNCGVGYRSCRWGGSHDLGQHERVAKLAFSGVVPGFMFIWCVVLLEFQRR